MEVFWAMTKDGSFIRNCIVVMKKNEKSPFLFKMVHGKTIVKLDGYAIIPKEEYNKLLKLKED